MLIMKHLLNSGSLAERGQCCLNLKQAMLENNMHLKSSLKSGCFFIANRACREQKYLFYLSLRCDLRKLRYTESDVIPCSTDEPDEDNVRQALRGAVIRSVL